MPTLIEIVEEDKIELTPSGSGRWVANCPFHEGDRDPSLTFYPSNTYFCFACEAWGDAFKWLVEYRKLTPKQALDYLGVDYHTRKSKSVIKVKNTFKMYPFLAEVAEKYHHFLLNQPGAIIYLRSRGLTLDTITRYKLGYTDGRVLNLKFAEQHELAQSVGLLTENNYELLSHRIVIPNFVQNHLCDYMIGRTVVNDRAKYLGIRTPKPIFGLYEQRRSPVLFVSEGQFDYLVLRQWGYPTVVVGGTHVTTSNLAVLKHRKIVYIPDNDTEGQSAAIRMQKSLEDVTILDYSSLRVKDVAELAEQEDGQEKFEAIVKEQLPWLLSLSPTTLEKWFPNLATTILLPST